MTFPASRAAGQKFNFTPACPDVSVQILIPPKIGDKIRAYGEPAKQLIILRRLSRQ
jgi:hypothetical protein